MLHDPDGHEIRFYSMESHTEIDTAQLVVPSAAAEPGYGCRSTLMARRSSMAL